MPIFFSMSHYNIVQSVLDSKDNQEHPDNFHDLLTHECQPPKISTIYKWNNQAFRTANW